MTKKLLDNVHDVQGFRVAEEGYNSGKYLSQRTTLRFLTTYFIQMVVAARVADHFGELGWRIYVLSGLSGFWPLPCDREV